jgi:hypothetical protein
VTGEVGRTRRTQPVAREQHGWAALAGFGERLWVRHVGRCEDLRVLSGLAIRSRSVPDAPYVPHTVYRGSPFS